MKLLIIRFSSIGDIVLTTPVIRAARKSFPDAEIFFLTKPAYAELVRFNPHLTQVLTLASDAAETKRQLKAIGFTAVLDLQNNAHSAWLRRGLARHVAVYRKNNFKKFLLVRFKLNLLRNASSVPEKYLAAAAKLGIADDALGCEVFTGSDAVSVIDKIIQPVSNVKRLAVCAGAKHFTKRYPPEKFASVLDKVLARKNVEVYLLGGQEDADSANQISELIQNPTAVKNFVGMLSLLETAEILRRMDVVLTNDTGLMHMASAFGKKIVALFGSSVTEFGFAPFRTPYIILQVNGLACRPCSHIGRASCPEGHFKCMLEISETEVASQVMKNLA
jgi:ADP-heptose:LPS heptosyltransferase